MPYGEPPRRTDGMSPTTRAPGATASGESAPAPPSVGRRATPSPERCFAPSSGGGAGLSAAEAAAEEVKAMAKEKSAKRDFMMSPVSVDQRASVTKSSELPFAGGKLAARLRLGRVDEALRI